MDALRGDDVLIKGSMFIDLGASSFTATDNEDNESGASDGSSESGEFGCFIGTLK